MNKYAHFAKPTPNVMRRRCVTKVRFPSQRQAERAAQRVLAKRGIALTPYNCALCLGWHNTSTSRSRA